MKTKRGTWARWLVVGCVSVLAALVSIAESASAEASQPSTLRVLTYNIHHGEGRDHRVDYERLAVTIARLKPDVVALQEVDNKTRRADGIDQAAELAGRLEMNHVFGKAIDFAGGGYGQAILSRFELANPKTHRLPSGAQHEQRIALEATVKPNNGLPEFFFVGTHLCHQSEVNRLRQTKRLDTLFTTRSESPVILGGDFNARPGSSPMNVLLEKNWLDAVAPDSKIDYILLRKSDAWEVVETKIIDEPIVSDHDPVLTVLHWKGASKSPN